MRRRYRHRLPIAKRKKSKPRPAAPTAQEPPPKLDATAQKAFDERPRPPPKPEKPEPAKRGTKPSGRKPIAAYLEAETHELRPDVCAGCGSAKLDAVDDVVEEKLHVVKEHGLHWKSLLRGSWMATDGTGIKVLVPELETAHNGYIELYRRDDVAVFQYEPDKAAENMLAKLRPFTGTLLADAEHRFNALYESGCVIEAGCNAHARRKLRDAEGAQPILPVEGGAFLGAMYGHEQAAKELGLGGDALRAHRQMHIRPIADELLGWMSAVAPSLLPSDTLAKAIRYYQNHRMALLRFIDAPELPIDNSPTERLFQNVAKLRLNMLFAGSTEGAHRACVLLGIAATCPFPPRARACLPRLGLRAPRHASRPVRTRHRWRHARRFQTATTLAQIERMNARGCAASWRGRAGLASRRR